MTALNQSYFSFTFIQQQRIAAKLILLRNTSLDGFGGLVVSMLASGSRVRWFDPDRNRWIFFRCEKILSMPSFGGEVK
jgi:hypothetical protein